MRDNIGWWRIIDHWWVPILCVMVLGLALVATHEPIEDQHRIGTEVECETR